MTRAVCTGPASSMPSQVSRPKIYTLVVVWPAIWPAVQRRSRQCKTWSLHTTKFHEPRPGRTDPEIYVSAHFKGPGAFPSSRLDSHRNFEPFWLGYVDFRPFPTRFVAILMFSTRNRPEINKKSTRIDRKSTRNPQEIDRESIGNPSEIDRKSFRNCAEI